MEKQLGWACKLGDGESLVISKAGQTVLSTMMESQIWPMLVSSVALQGEGPEKGQWPLPNFLSWRKLFSSSCLDARHFSSSMYATGAIQAAAPLLELRGSESVSR